MIPLSELKAEALKLGFVDVGVTAATIPEDDIRAYQQWIHQSYHGDMAYMENALRCHPEQLLPGAKTAIIFISYYKQEKAEFREGEGLIASYARGRDYHHVHRKRLKKMIAWLEEKS